MRISRIFEIINKALQNHRRLSRSRGSGFYIPSTNIEKVMGPVLKGTIKINYLNGINHVLYPVTLTEYSERVLNDDREGFIERLEEKALEDFFTKSNIVPTNDLLEDGDCTRHGSYR